MTDTSRIAALSDAKRALLQRRLGERARARPGAGTAVLSFAQERLWVLGELTPGLVAYNTTRVVEFDGEVDVERLRRALAVVVERHEVLRTRIERSDDGTPSVTLASGAHPAVDTATLPAAGALDDVVSEFAARPFDLGADDLIRALVVSRPGAGDAVALVVHHIASDEGSRALLWRELDAAYVGESLPRLDVQYADLAARERAEFQAPGSSPDVAWWREHLAGAPQYLELPYDFRRPSRQSYRGARHRVRLTSSVAAGLRELAGREGTTVFAAVSAALAWTLSRWADATEVVIGMPTSGRDRADTERVIGLLVNTIALRVRCDGQPSFGALLGQLRDEIVAGMQHQRAPFDKVVEAIAPSRDAGRNPVFQVLVNGVSGSGEDEVRLGALRGRAVEFDAAMTKFDLGVLVAERADTIELVIEYATDLFSARTIDALAEQVCRLLEVGIAQPTTPLDALDTVPISQRQRFVTDVNDTAVAYPQACLHDLVADQMARTPDAPAVADADVELTYRQLDAQTSALAARLRSAGVGRDSPVVVAVPRSVRAVVAILAVLRAGGAYVPLDPGHPADRAAHMVRDSGARVVIADSTAGHLATDTVAMVMLDELPDVGAQAAPASAEPHRDDPDRLAYIIYTSGSTGRPKGVAVAHRGVVNRLRWMQRAFALTPGDTFLLKTPLTFDVSVWELFAPLVTGARLFVARPDGHRDPRYLLEVLEREAVSVAHFVPSMLDAFLDARGDTGDTGDTGGLAGLRAVICSGEALTYGTKERFFARMPDVELHNLYGPTEASIEVTAARCLPGPRHPVTIGAPIDNVQVFVVDRHGHPVPVGVPGELMLAGVQLARGYVGQDELTAKSFVSSDLAPGGRVYRSGDVVRWTSDGQLSYLGRRDRQVKIRGLRIEPGEIEAVLLESPLVAHCAVAVVATPSGEPSLAAYVMLDDTVTSSGVANVVAELASALRVRVPEYMVPASIQALPTLPLTASGKLDHAALPAPATGAAQVEKVLPRSPTEHAVFGIWRDLLGSDDFGVLDDFFGLGGHSLLAVRVISAIARELNVTLELHAVFEQPTVAGLARLVETQPAGPAASAVRVDRAARRVAIAEPATFAAALAAETAGARGTTDGAVFPLSWAQERMWVLDQLDAASPAYLVRRAYRVRTPLDVGALDRALQMIAARHDSLRTRFVLAADGPIAIVADHGSWPLRRHPPMSENAVRAAISVAAREPFDLAEGRLARCDLYQLSDGHVLVASFHHIAVDGQSLDVLFDELTQLYADGAHTDAGLPDLTTQYPDFAMSQRDTPDARLDAQLDHWRAKLAGAPATCGIPGDRPRPISPAGTAGRTSLALGALLAERIRRTARAHATTPFAVLYAASALVIGRLAGREDVVLGTVVAGRAQRDLTRTVGLFANTLVLRLDLRDVASFGDLVDRAASDLRSAQAHQDLPFDRLVEALRPPREPGVNPLFQVMLTMQPAEGSPRTLGAAALEPFEVDATFARFDLSLAVTDLADDVRITVDYATDIYERSTAESLLARLVHVLDAGCEPADADVADISIVLQPEADRMLRDGSRGGPQFTGTAVDLIRATVAARPTHVAVRAPGRESLTYDELWRRTGQVAATVVRRVGRGGLVGIMVERSADLVVAALGVWRAGCAYVPLDPSYPAARLDFMRRDAELDLVLHDADLHDADLHDADSAPDPADTDLPAGDDLAYVIYTSGSTGQPKGVAIEHGALANLLQSMSREPGFADSDVMLAVTTFSFDIAALELFLPLIAGGTVVVADRDAVADPVVLANLLAAEHASVVQATPSTFRMLVDSGWTGAPVRVLCGGEALPPDLARRLRPLVGELWNCYGPTETTIWSTVARVDEPDDLSIGHPIENTIAYVLDDALRLVPPGTRGDLWLAGTGLARGYLHRPELTAARFVPDPLRPGRAMYRTGDVATWTLDGRLRVFGREDDQVKLRGHRIELGEIEAALLSLPGIRGAAAAVRNDVLVAYCVADGDTDAHAAGDSADVIGRLRAVLPPSFVPTVVVWLPSLPLTPNGKLDRAALPSPPRQPTVGRRPQTDVERTVAAEWGAALDVADPRLEDEFFGSGGHSLLATRLAARLATSLHRPVALRTIFQAGTLGELAALIESDNVGSSTDAPPAVGPQRLPRTTRRARITELDDVGAVATAVQGRAAPGTGEVTVFAMSSAQERMWLLHELTPDDPSQLVVLARHVTGRLEPDRLLEALNGLTQRHEILRTTYRQLDDLLVQVVHERLAPDLHVADLRDANRADALDRLRRDALRPMDLRHGPALRAHLVRTGDDTALLALVTHHIALDGWSIERLVADLAALYAGTASPVDESVQFGDYADWERNTRSEESDRPYWLEQLAGAPPETTVTPFPPAQRADRAAGRRIRRTMPSTATEQVAQLAAETSSTPFAVHVAVLTLLMYRQGAGDDLVLGTPFATRSFAGGEDILGPLLNTVALRVPVAGSRAFRDHLGDVTRICQDAVMHGAYPFERLVSELGVERLRDRHPVFQVLIALQQARPTTPGLAGLALDPVDIDWQVPHFDLRWSLTVDTDTTDVLLEYRADRYDSVFADWLLERYLGLLGAVLDDPGSTLDALPVVTTAEQTVLAGWEGTTSPPSAALDIPIPEQIRSMATRRPLDDAVSYNGRTSTFGELLAAATGVAEELRSQGVRAGDRVAIGLGHGLEWPVAVLGTWLAGAAFVPVDPGYPEARRNFMLDDSACRVVLTDTGNVAQFAPATRIVLDVTALRRADGTNTSAAPCLVEDAAYVVYTSGSTGAPKGVLVGHGELAAYAAAQRDAVYGGLPDPGGLRVGVNASTSFDFAINQLIHLAYGSTLVPIPEDVRRDPPAFVRHLADAAVDVLDATPTHMAALVAAGLFERADTPSVLLVGGEAIDGTLWQTLRGSGREVRAVYGPTETTIIVTGAAYRDSVVPTIGRPYPGVLLRVVDPRGQLVPVGAPGELWVAGRQVSAGYLDRPELTAHRFVTVEGRRWYRTGDIVRYLPGGLLQFVGRDDDQVKIRGHRIELGEVTAGLRALDAVSDAAVVAHDGRLIAVVVPSGADVDAANVRRELRARLPEAMIPSRVVTIADIPRGPTGKLDDAAIIEAAAREESEIRTSSPPPPADDGEHGPSTQLVAELMSSLLGVPLPGPDDDFFDLGGDSLLASRFVAQLRVMQIDVPLRTVFAEPTARQLAAHVDAAILSDLDLDPGSTGSTGGLDG